MKLAVYYHLPFGGAQVSTQAILEKLEKKHQIKKFKLEDKQFLPILPSRLRQDATSLFTIKRHSRQLAQKINQADFNAILVTHDPHFQAPWLLRYLDKPTVFFCQEPTRAFFEQFLSIDRSWPLLNRLYEKLIRSLKRNIEIKNAQAADRIVANSAFGAETIFRSYGVPAVPAHLGVDLDLFYPDDSFERLNQVFLVGNAEPQKGIPYAIKVLARLPLEIRPKLIVAGPRQSNYQPLKKLADQHGVNLEVHSSLNQDQMRHFYQSSLLTLATAHLEPFGLSPIESMACGTPVVAVNEGGFKETVIDQQTGLLLPRNLPIFSQKLAKLLQDQDKLDQLSQNCPTRARQFTWSKTAQKINQQLKDVSTS